MNLLKASIGLVLISVSSLAFALGGISGALDFIDSLMLIILIITVIIHALVVFFKCKNNTLKQKAIIATSFLFSALTIMFWLIQFLNNIANSLYYSWPNYYGGVLLPVILILLLIIIVWTLKMTLQQYSYSNDNTD